MFYRVNKRIDVILILQLCFFNIDSFLDISSGKAAAASIWFRFSRFDPETNFSIQTVHSFCFNDATVNKNTFIQNYSLRLQTGSNSIS